MRGFRHGGNAAASAAIAAAAASAAASAAIAAVALRLGVAGLFLSAAGMSWYQNRMVADQNRKTFNFAEMVSAHTYLPTGLYRMVHMNIV